MYNEFLNIVLLAVALFLVLVFIAYLIIRKLFRDLSKKDLEFIQYTMNAQENERAAIAREIHDNIGPTLSIVQMQIGFMLERQSPEQMELMLPKIRQQLDDAVELCRNLSHTLSADFIDGHNLQLMLEKHVEVVKHTSQLNLTMDYVAEGLDLKGIDTASLMRIIQELISNTIKHADARKAGIVVERENRSLRVSYWDDGKGLPAKLPPGGMGMRNIEKRVEILKGKLMWKNGVRGIEVNMLIPITHRI